MDSDQPTTAAAPPAAHLFAKGRSGNPRGRPRQLPSVAALVAAVSAAERAGAVVRLTIELPPAAPKGVAA